jgi:predicted HTH transcriptional regulator
MNVTEKELATLWPTLAQREGHEPRHLNNREFQLRQANGKTGAKAANLAHYNTQKSLENQAKCLAAMRKGHVTAPNIAEAANLTPDVARKAIYCLEEAKKVTRVGKVTVKGGTATVWKLNVVN